MLKKLFSGLTGGVWLQLLPLLVMFAALWMTAYPLFALAISTVKFWEYLLFGWVGAAVVYWLGLGIIARFFPRWVAAGFAWFYLFLYGVNIVFLHHAGTVLLPYYLSIASFTNWFAYVTPWVWVIIGICALNGAFAVWLVYRHAPALAQMRLRGLMLVLVLVEAAPYLRDRGLFRPTEVVTSTMDLHEVGMWRVDQTFTLRMLANNPLEILARAIIYRPSPMAVYPVSALAALAPALRVWHLPLGPRHYPSLGLKPFKHIVVFASESVALDFLAPYNTNLPPELTPFYGSTTMTQGMFVNYQCVALPTQPGVSVMYDSHPNANGLLGGSFQESLIKLLNARGYDTYYVMSATETFLNNNVVFKRMGFQHVLGTGTWLQDPRKSPYVEGRGLMDREMFGSVLDLMEQNRDKKTFMHVINVDTHSPGPRENYGNLQYPPTPASLARLISNPDARKIMESIFRHDYDLGQTLRQMQERNLLTEDTLVVITADHNYPPGDILRAIPGYPSSYYTRLPLVFLSGQPLPHADLRQLHSQLDFAPTILHLLALPIPEGWWGESIFAPGKSAPYVYRWRRDIYLKSDRLDTMVLLDHPGGADAALLVHLFDSLYLDRSSLVSGTTGTNNIPANSNN